MSKRYPGGYIFRSNPTIVGPTGTPPEGGSAPGVWTLEQASYYTKQGIWPQRVIPKGLYSWGVNNDGQLGQNNRVYRSSPVQVGTDTNWVNVSAKASNSLSTTSNNSIYSWGNNQFGQLGLNDKVYRSSPVQIGALTNWAVPAISSNPFCFSVKSDGTLWAWGFNGNGQLGQNNTIYRSSPVQIGSDTNWSTVDCGTSHTLAVKTDGTLWSWGDNGKGQLGQNISYTISKSSPVQVGVLTNWSKVAAGSATSFAIKTDGTLWSWGRNTSGQLGQNISYLVYRSSPVQVGALTTWASVSTASNSCGATQTNGTLWTWGSNNAGQLGQNDRVYRSSPVQVGALMIWSNISFGAETTLVTQTNGTLWAWGSNNFGQLGQNNKVSYSSPVQVGANNTWIKIAAGGGFCIATSS